MSDGTGLNVSRLAGVLCHWSRLDRMIQIMRLLHQVFQVGMLVGLTLTCVLKTNLGFIHVAILKKRPRPSNMTVLSIKVYHLFSFFQTLQPWQGHNPDSAGLATCVPLTGIDKTRSATDINAAASRKTCCNQRASVASHKPAPLFLCSNIYKEIKELQTRWSLSSFTEACSFWSQPPFE